MYDRVSRWRARLVAYTALSVLSTSTRSLGECLPLSYRHSEVTEHNIPSLLTASRSAGRAAAVTAGPRSYGFTIAHDPVVPAIADHHDLACALHSIPTLQGGMLCEADVHRS